MMNFVEDFLEYLGLRPEPAHTPTLPPGMALEKVETLSAIPTIFNSDATRQQSESYYFSGNVAGHPRPDRSRFLPEPGVHPKFMQGPSGRLPFFKMADHLK
jgi:hypothetical protein